MVRTCEQGRSRNLIMSLQRLQTSFVVSWPDSFGKSHITSICSLGAGMKMLDLRYTTLTTWLVPF